VVAAVLSLALSLWGAWAAFIPNPDAALYLRAAELIAAGRWTEAVQLFPWPLYSAAIAAVMSVTGFKAFIAAQIVNALLGVVTTVSFIGLLHHLANGDRLVVLCAAIVILLQPHLSELRASIVRDNGYDAFFILTLYLVARDLATPRLGTKFGIGLAIAAAGVFRIEGFALIVLVPLYYLLRHREYWARPSTILAIIVGCLLIIPGLILWLSGILGELLRGRLELHQYVSHWSAVTNTIIDRVRDLKLHFLFPNGGGNSWGAYVGLVLGIVLVNTVRAVTLPLAILTAFAFFPKRLMPRAVNGFVLWFTLAQLPMLIAFTAAMLLLDKRYAMGMALVLDVPLSFLLAEVTRQWRAGAATRFFLPVTAIVLAAVWAFSVPRASKLAYLEEAGQWIGRELPANVRVLTNDSRIAYYSGRPYGPAMQTCDCNTRLTDTETTQFDYFAFVADDANDLPAELQKLPKQLVRSFAGKDGHTAFIYERE